MSSTITIRNVPDKQKRALKKRAALNGRSMEAEARAILGEAVIPPKPVLSPLKTTALSPQAEAALARLQKMFAPKPGESRTSLSDELIAERRAEAARE